MDQQEREDTPTALIQTLLIIQTIKICGTAIQITLLQILTVVVTVIGMATATATVAVMTAEIPAIVEDPTTNNTLL